MEHEIYGDLKANLETELKDRILPYWLKKGLDRENGGFTGRINGANRIVGEAPKSAVLGYRMLWTFSAAYRLYGDHDYRKFADYMFDYLNTCFLDEVHGGVYWMISHDGHPVDQKKHSYAQSFAIYAYSEYYRATGRKKALSHAIDLFKQLDKHSRKYTERGFYEAFDRQWNPMDDVSLSVGDEPAPHSMNTHLHILEALTNLHRVWTNPDLSTRLRECCEIMMTDIYDSSQKHFLTLFDEDWSPINNVYSYGHDIEAAWLLLEAVYALGNDDLTSRAEKIALDVSYATQKEGIDHKHGGIFNSGSNKRVIDTDKQWWAQAEAIVGFCYAYKLNGDIKFLRTALDIWNFINRHVKDGQHGEWFFRVNKTGEPYHEEDKLGPWKCPYHTARACFEIIKNKISIQDTPEIKRMD